MFDYTVTTSKTIEEAVSNIEEHLMEEKFGVLWNFDLKEKLQSKGLDFERDFKVLEVCNPHEAHRVISENLLAGYFLPCKIVVYDDNGMTKIGMPRPSALITMMNDEKIQSLAKDIEDRLIRCIDKCV